RRPVDIMHVLQVFTACCLIVLASSGWDGGGTIPTTTTSTRAPYTGDFVMIYMSAGAVVSTAYDNAACTKGCNFLSTRLSQTLSAYANAGYELINSSTYPGAGSQPSMIVYILKRHF
ncbi:hypothetical protein AAVH_22445, partial [Aphelenchoides avenae]